MATRIRHTSRSTKPIVDALNGAKTDFATQLTAMKADIAALAALANATKAIVNAGTGTVATADVTPTVAAASVHNDRSETIVTAANATNLATAIELVAQLHSVYAFHLADTLAHKTASVIGGGALPCTNLASACTTLYTLATSYDDHRYDGVHYTVDSINEVDGLSLPDDLPSLIALANAFKASLNAHMAAGPSTSSVRVS